MTIVIKTSLASDWGISSFGAVILETQNYFRATFRKTSGEEATMNVTRDQIEGCF